MQEETGWLKATSGSAIQSHDIKRSVDCCYVFSLPQCPSRRRETLTHKGVNAKTTNSKGCGCAHVNDKRLSGEMLNVAW
jgi:hypothetical protein